MCLLRERRRESCLLKLCFKSWEILQEGIAVQLDLRVSFLQEQKFHENSRQRCASPSQKTKKKYLKMYKRLFLGSIIASLVTLEHVSKEYIYRHYLIGGTHAR